MDDLTLAARFGAALALGVLLGLERERSKSAEHGFAGVRTLGLIALAGALSAFFDQELRLPGLALAVFGAVVALVVVSYAVTASRGEIGITTEVTAVMAFLLGSLCVRGYVSLAASIGVATALVLALKEWLHGLAQRIESADVEATLKFTIVTLIVLPLVPDRAMGPPPFDVLNPYGVWLMVVLISGLNFASYILVKLVGTEHGIGVTGLLGGLVSSTAVTLGFAQRSRRQPAESSALALGILLAWTVMFVRVIAMVTVISRLLAARLALVLGGLALASLAMCWSLWRRRSGSPDPATVTAGQNPFELGQAIQFGLLFALVTVVVRMAQVYLGDAGLYLAGALAGLTDVDAITLSMANMATSDPSTAGPASTTIAIAVGANTIVKAGMAAVVGERRLGQLIALATAVLFAVGGALLLFTRT